jgi:hypothetical protein
MVDLSSCEMNHGTERNSDLEIVDFGDWIKDSAQVFRETFKCCLTIPKNFGWIQYISSPVDQILPGCIPDSPMALTPVVLAGHSDSLFRVSIIQYEGYWS